MIIAQCHTNRNYGGLQILSVVCYMLYQTDLVIRVLHKCTKVNLKKHFSHSGEGREYVSISSNTYSDLCGFNSK